MRWAVFSDIHANWEALETAVDYTRSHSVDQYAVLGDTIGYGANPNECLDWVVKNAAVQVMGNHEQAIHDAALRDGFTDFAREAIFWTDKVLEPSLKGQIRGLDYVRKYSDLTFAHGSVHEPETFHYLKNFGEARPSFAVLETPVCFIGHTHTPCCFCESAGTAAYLPPGTLALDPRERYILNPGSVGQPRDRDWRLSFGIYDTQKQTFQIVRLEYDNKKAAEKIRKAELPRFLADRLLLNT